jgi:transposase
MSGYWCIRFTGKLNDAQWLRVRTLFADTRRNPERGGRPSANVRLVLNGVIWKMSRGTSWYALPAHYPSPTTCGRYYRAWLNSGVLLSVMTELFGEAGQILTDLQTRGSY